MGFCNLLKGKVNLPLHVIEYHDREKCGAKILLGALASALGGCMISKKITHSRGG
jgi:hypothetical protein